MRKNLLVLIIIFQATFCGAQTTTPILSDCTGTDKIKKKYLNDAEGIALQRINKFNSVYKDSVFIPSSYSDSIQRALMAVYNATSLPARDSVVKIYQIHAYHYQALNTHAFFAVSADAWVKELVLGKFPTSNASVNALMTRYHLTKSYHLADEHGGPYTYLFFTSDSNLNADALIKEWKAIVTCKADFSTETLMGDGSMIYVDTITPAYIQLRYSFACGDCFAGCIYRRNWIFRVDNECFVDYIGSYGVDPSNAVCAPPTPETEDEDAPLAVLINNKPVTAIYPNPFSDKISLININEHTKYIVESMLGQVLCAGSVSHDSDIDLHWLSSGVYLLHMANSEGTNTIRIVRD